MGIETALWMYSPTSEYKLNNTYDAIDEWRDRRVAEPTAQQISAAQAALDGLTVSAELSADKTTINGDGADFATVTVTYHMPYPDSIQIFYNGTPVDIALPAYVPGSFAARQATIEFDSNQPGSSIEITLAGEYQGLIARDTLIIEVE